VLAGEEDVEDVDRLLEISAEAAQELTVSVIVVVTVVAPV
jgi:hypothetical protein